MRIKLDDKNALVCGSSQGIGKAIAKQLAESGANVTLLARNTDALNKLRNDLTNNGRQQHRVISADFNDNDSVFKNVRQELAEVEGYQILINNSGGPPPGPALDAKKSEFMATFQHHLINFHQITQLLIPGMKKCQYGRVINVISTSVKQPLPNLAVSNTVRGAVASWAKTLANELGQFGITVNNLLPGATNTSRLQNILESKAHKSNRRTQYIVKEEIECIPVRRFGEPEELAHVCTFLASDLAGYINGINLPVDGGRTSSI